MASKGHSVGRENSNNGEEDGMAMGHKFRMWSSASVVHVYNLASEPRLRIILQQRGINTATMHADDMRVMLSNHEDFVNEKTIV